VRCHSAAKAQVPLADDPHKYGFQKSSVAGATLGEA